MMLKFAKDKHMVIYTKKVCSFHWNWLDCGTKGYRQLFLCFFEMIKICCYIFSKIANFSLFLAV